MAAPRVGILTLQGAAQDHIPHLLAAGAEPVLVRRREELFTIDGLIIPGGESSVMGRYLEQYDMTGPIRAGAREGMPVWGICAGAILMAAMVDGRRSRSLALLDFHAFRNSYGRQLASGGRLVIAPDYFGEEGEAMPFIRAPRFELPASSGARAAAWLEDGSPVAVAAPSGFPLATAFHPELTGIGVFHRLITEAALAFNSAGRIYCSKAGVKERNHDGETEHNRGRRSSSGDGVRIDENKGGAYRPGRNPPGLRLPRLGKPAGERRLDLQP